MREMDETKSYMGLMGGNCNLNMINLSKLGTRTAARRMTLNEFLPLAIFKLLWVHRGI